MKRGKGPLYLIILSSLSVEGELLRTWHLFSLKGWGELERRWTRGSDLGKVPMMEKANIAQEQWAKKGRVQHEWGSCQVVQDQVIYPKDLALIPRAIRNYLSRRPIGSCNSQHFIFSQNSLALTSGQFCNGFGCWGIGDQYLGLVL